MKSPRPQLFKALGLLAVVGVLIAIAAQLGLPSSSDDLPEGMRLDRDREPLVVFVLIDTLRRDHVSAFGYDRPTTPNLDALAREGFVARGMLAHSSQTVPSVSSMWTSTLPSTHGVQFELRTQGFGNDGEARKPLLADDNLTLAEVLSAEGYFAAAEVSNPWLRDGFGFGQGFAHYEVSPFLDERRGISDGAAINEAASKLIRAHPDSEMFLYLHYMDVHNPYAHDGKLPAVFREGPGEVVYTNGPIEGVSNEDLAYTIAAYDDGLVYLDGLIGRLAEELEEIARQRDVLLVVTSDHGDEFLEHGGMGHGSTLYPELIESFAIFWRPERRMEHPPHESLSGTIDIAPTILDLLGIDRPKEMVGRSLLRPSTQEATVVSELASTKAAIKSGWGLVRDWKTGEEEVVAYTATPESKPSPQLAAELAFVLDSLELRETPRDDTVIRPSLKMQLEALGYVE